tara:strand:- start:26 stop:424 length:399 start_codon:yes stop_codon:yes gene_type:complete
MALQYNAATLAKGDQFKGYNSQANPSAPSGIDHSLPMSGMFNAAQGDPALAGHTVPQVAQPSNLGSYAPGEIRPVAHASGVYMVAAEGTRVDSVYLPYVGFTGHAHMDASGVTHTVVTNPPVSGISTGWIGS